jgi:myo-inositol-1(or 4)-monophosphatase
MSELLRIAQEAAVEAGTFLKESVGNVKTVETKKGEVRNLVSDIDKGSEERIIRRIRDRYPHHAILAEESGGSTSEAEYRWIIDPLDGTTNFLHGLPIFSVTIGVEHRGEIVAGVIYNPNMEELFVAEKGSGAFLNGKRISVSGNSELINSLVVTGFPYNIAENPDHAVDHFVHFVYEARGVRRLGSAAIDLAYVAMGRFDGFWEVSLQPWDMAAGVLLVHEAGGRTSDFSGRATSVYRKQIAASNGLIHDAMVRVLGKAGGSSSG